MTMKPQMIAPKFADLASQNQGKLVFLKVNVDECEVSSCAGVLHMHAPPYQSMKHTRASAWRLMMHVCEEYVYQPAFVPHLQRTVPISQFVTLCGIPS